MCELFVNVFTAVEELWEGFETAKGLTLGSLSWLIYAAYSARKAW